MSPRRLGVRVSCALVAVLLISRSSSCTARRPVWRPSTRCSGSFWPALQHAARGRRHSRKQTGPASPAGSGAVLDRRADPVLHRGNEREPQPDAARTVASGRQEAVESAGSTRKATAAANFFSPPPPPPPPPPATRRSGSGLDLPQGPTLLDPACRSRPLEVAARVADGRPSEREVLALRLCPTEAFCCDKKRQPRPRRTSAGSPLPARRRSSKHDRRAAISTAFRG
jgi:hypothetical protein